MTTHPRTVAVWRVLPWIGAALLLVFPSIAMRYSPEIRWTAGDFTLFAVLLAGLCGAFEAVVRLSGQWSYRLATLLAAGAAVLMVLANLAVGIAGSEDNPANLAFFGVLVVGVAGTALARFHPTGMARTMVAMAAAQVLAARVEPRGFVLLFTGVYAVIWLVAALLYRKAARA